MDNPDMNLFLYHSHIGSCFISAIIPVTIAILNFENRYFNGNLLEFATIFLTINVLEFEFDAILVGEVIIYV